MPPPKDDDKVSVTFEAPRDLVDRLAREAQESQRPRSWIIRQLLIRALEAEEKTA